jgi:hypothetical protein
MSAPIYMPGSADIDVSVRWDHNPQDLPAPTGYYPNRKNAQQGVVTASPVMAYRDPARREVGDQSEAVDQHPFLEVAATWQRASYEHRDGRNDPLAAGLPTPVIRLLQLFYQRAQGSSDTRFLDVPGRVFPPYGSQDGVSWAYYQDARLAMAPADANGQAADSLRALPPSPAHGWTSIPAINATQAEVRKSGVLVQQHTPHQDRLSNATAAGQTYSQRTAHLPRTTGSTPSWRPRG